jgi:hypothetical protein
VRAAGRTGARAEERGRSCLTRDPNEVGSGWKLRARARRPSEGASARLQRRRARAQAHAWTPVVRASGDGDERTDLEGRGVRWPCWFEVSPKRLGCCCCLAAGCPLPLARACVRARPRPRLRPRPLHRRREIRPRLSPPPRPLDRGPLEGFKYARTASPPRLPDDPGDPPSPLAVPLRPLFPCSLSLDRNILLALHAPFERIALALIVQQLPPAARQHS